MNGFILERTKVNLSIYPQILQKFSISLIFICFRITNVVKLEFLKLDFHNVDQRFRSNLQNVYLSMNKIVKIIERC